MPPPAMPPWAPSSLRLLSGIVPFPLPSTAPLLSVSSPFFPFQAPFLHSPARALSAPSGSLAPALSRRPSDSQHWLFSASSTLLPFRTVRSNRTERRAYVRAERRAFPNKGPLFGHIWPNGDPKFGQTGPNIGPQFSPVWPNGAKRKGVLGADAEKPGRGAGREHVPKSERRVLKKRKETRGRGAVPGGRRR